MLKAQIYIKKLLIFSTPVFIRHLWQLKTVVFLHWSLIRVVLLFHRQTLANRTKPGPSFLLQMWACMNIVEYMHNIITALFIIENSAQTSFRFSPISFCTPRWFRSFPLSKDSLVNYKSFGVKFALSQHLGFCIRYGG
jgi:hypothetical protein